MGLIGDVEQVAGDVAHVGADVVQVGEDAAGDVGGLLDSLHAFLSDAGLGGVAKELAQLAEQADQMRRRLASAAGSTHWSGAAAEGFARRAQQRQEQLGQLVAALDSAHEAVAAAYTVAGIL